jgi:hypothetical protein
VRETAARKQRFLAAPRLPTLVHILLLDIFVLIRAFLTCIPFLRRYAEEEGIREGRRKKEAAGKENEGI